MGYTLLLNKTKYNIQQIITLKILYNIFYIGVELIRPKNQYNVPKRGPNIAISYWKAGG